MRIINTIEYNANRYIDAHDSHTHAHNSLSFPLFCRPLYSYILNVNINIYLVLAKPMPLRQSGRYVFYNHCSYVARDDAKHLAKLNSFPENDFSIDRSALTSNSHAKSEETYLMCL